MQWIQLALILAGILLFLSIFAAPVVFGVWIVRPLDRAAKRNRRPTRFTILDFFGLIFLVQVPMALIHGFVPRSEMVIYWVFMALGWFASVAVWGMAVKTFSNAGITAVWTRALLVFFVLPVAYFGTFGILILAIALFNDQASAADRAMMVLVGFVLVVCVIAAGIITRRVAPVGWRFNASEVSPFAEGIAPSEADMLAARQAKIDELAAQQTTARQSVEHLFRDAEAD